MRAEIQKKLVSPISHRRKRKVKLRFKRKERKKKNQRKKVILEVVWWL